MNEASRWRYNVAQGVGALYASNPNVAAVILGGSTARGHADSYSDVEIGVFWHRDPSEDERYAVVQGANADLIRLYAYEPDEQVWCDDFMIGRDETGREKTGLLIEVSHYKSEFVEYVLHQVLREHATNVLWHNLISGIADAVPLHGIELVKTWQGQADHYPRELSIAMVRKYGVVDHFWRWEMYLKRDNNLPLIYQSFSQIQQQLLQVLLGLNRVYYFGFKWINVVDERLTVKPPHLLKRLQSVYQVAPAEGAQQVAELVEEVFDLVETHLPEVDINRLRQIFRYRRPIWTHAPLDIEP